MAWHKITKSLLETNKNPWPNSKLQNRRNFPMVNFIEQLNVHCSKDEKILEVLGISFSLAKDDLASV